MNNQRILLFLSPVLLFVPSILPMADTPGQALFGLFFSRILRQFPWNCLMAFLCYNYSAKLGRETFWWSVGGFAVPAFAPLVLAFMPPKAGSRAARAQPKNAAPVKNIKGTFEERFPLLTRGLSEQTESVRLEQQTRFAQIPANFEFSMMVEENGLPQVLSEAQLRKFTVWAAPGHRLLGAGLVQAAEFDPTVAWLRRSCAENHKLEVSSREADGRLRFFEYHA